jgi:hypothetical protein
MSEAAASAPASAPTTISESIGAKVGAGEAPENDNAQAQDTTTRPVPTTVAGAGTANDNAGAPPTLDDVFHADNLGDLAEKKWRLKNGDQERVVDTRELLRQAQIGAAGYDAFRKAAEREKAITAQEERLRAQVGELQRGFKESPLGMLRRMGLEDQLYNELEQELNYQQLPPDQRARADLDRERQQVEQERLAWQREQEQRQQAQQEQQLQVEAQRHQAAFVASYTQALDGIGMPANEKLRGRAIRLMAQAHGQALRSGVEVPVDVLARHAYEDLSEAGRAFVGSAPPDKARELLGEDWIRGVQQHDVQRVQTTQQPRTTDGKFAPTKQAAANEPRTRQRFGSMAEFRKALDGKGK